MTKIIKHTSYGLKKVTNPKTLVVLLHGYGSNADDLISLAPDLDPYLEDAIFISPNAPFDFEGSMFAGYQWYSLMDRSTEAMLDGYKKAKPILNEFLLMQLAQYNLKFSDLVLCGFSQGGMMSLHYALECPNELKGVISFSGYLLGYEEFDKYIASKPKTLITHGDMDVVVPYEAFEYTEDKLKSIGADLSSYTAHGLGHGIDYGCLSAAQKFLKKL